MGRTRVRRRRVVALISVLGVLGALSGSVANAVGVGGRSEDGSSRTYVVGPGDTLWSIATRFYPSADPRLAVSVITEVEGVDPAALVPGQQLTLPSVG